MLRRGVPVVLGLAAVLAAAGSLTAGSPSARPVVLGHPAGVGGSWVAHLGDDFDGASLDRDLWQPSRYGEDGGDAPFNPGIEAAWFSSANVSVTGGHLVLSVEEDPRTIDGRRYPYSSGVVQTVPGWELRPGTFLEARIDVPECAGCWPAFWAVPTETWPPELDVVEFFDSSEDTRPSFNYIASPTEQSGPEEYGDPAVDHRDGFHVYGMWWDGTRAVPYLDGVAYPELTATGVPDVAMSVVLNLSVRADGAPAAGERVLVDWVRVWQPQD